MGRAGWVLVAAVATAAVAAHSAVGAPAERKLLKNGDFESGVAGWTVLNQSGLCEFEPDTKVKQTGKQGLRVQKSGPGTADWLKQSATLPAGAKDVRATCWFKVDKGARADVTVYFFDAKGDTIGKGDMALVGSGPNKKWEQADEKYAVPKGATGIGVNVKVAAAGTFWLDGLELFVAGAAPGGPLALANGGFEAGLDGWTPLAFGSESAATKADAAVHAEGKAAAQIVRASPRLFPEDGLAAEVVCDESPGKVRLRFQQRADGDARAAVVLQAFDANDACIATERAPLAGEPGKFAAGTLALAAPPGTQRLVVSLVVGGAGTAWFDDVTLTQEK